MPSHEQFRLAGVVFLAGAEADFDWLGAVDGSDFASVSDYQLKAA